jgi:DNA-binding transcriptional LysR family regulator
MLFIMDLRHLETFVKIAELNSFTKAAEELYITQPTVSKQIVDLEGYFGVKLIDRTKRQVALTRAGEILFKYGKDFMALRKETIDALEAFKGLKKGTVIVGASTIPGIYILPHVLNIFREQYSGIRIKLIVSDSKDIMDKMEQGQIDVGFVGARDNSKKLEFRKLFEDTIVIIAPRNYPASVTLDDVKKYPFIMREQGSGTRNFFYSALKKAGINPMTDLQVVAELTDTEAIKEAVRSGMGISCVSKIAAKGATSQGHIITMRVKGMEDLKRSFYLVSRKGKSLLPQVKALIEIIDRWKEHDKI